jgi:uncharacterized protein YwqG
MKMSTIVITILVLTLAFFLKNNLKRASEIPSFSSEKSRNMKKEVPTEAFYKKRFEEIGLSAHWDFFKTLLKNEIQMEPTASNEAALGLGQSKIGGQPDLPKHTAWFQEDDGKYLSFIAQINLAEVTGFDVSKQLPTHGILYFFYSAEQSAWGFEIRDKDKFKVFFYDGDFAQLEKTDFPTTLETRYKPCKLAFQTAVSLPSWEQEYERKRLNKTELDKYLNLTDGFYTEINKLLGHSDNVQGAMELECELVTNGLYCGDETGYNDPKAKVLAQNANDWTLLLQIDSVDEADMMWGDLGQLYFWIKKEDLKNKKFDKSWLILQCG